MSNGNIGVKRNDEGIGVKVKGEGGGIRKPMRLPTPGMCFYHNEIPATYVCNKCGRAICVNCAEKYGALTFCSQCNPYPGRSPEPEELPDPGRPGTFTGGAVGAILVGIMSVIIGITTLYMILNWELESEWMALLVISTLIFMVGCIIMGVGFLGFSRSYSSHFGVVALIFSIIAPVLLLIFTIYSFEYYYHYYDYYWGGGYSESYYYLESWILWLGHVMVGVMLILMGVSSLLIGKHTGKRGVSIAAGVLLIVSGGMSIGALGLIGVAWFLLSAAAFVQAGLFLGAPGRSKLK